MAGPRFAPRDYAADAAGFGRVPTLRWKSPSERQERVFLRAAQLQHQQVLRIRERIEAHDMGAKQYAAAAGTSYPRLLRMMRGEAILRLEDIALADLVLGDIIDEPSRAPEQQRASDLPHALLESLPERIAQAVVDRLNAARRPASGQHRPDGRAPVGFVPRRH